MLPWGERQILNCFSSAFSADQQCCFRLLVSIQADRQADRQTDRQTDTHTQHTLINVGRSPPGPYGPRLRQLKPYTVGSLSSRASNKTYHQSEFLLGNHVTSFSHNTSSQFFQSTTFRPG